MTLRNKDSFASWINPGGSRVSRPRARGAHPEVTEAHIIMGIYDIIAKIEAPDSETLKAIVFDEIRLIGGVQVTLTMIIIDPED